MTTSNRGADDLVVCQVRTKEAPAALADDKIVRPTVVRAVTRRVWGHGYTSTAP